MQTSNACRQSDHLDDPETDDEADSPSSDEDSNSSLSGSVFDGNVLEEEGVSRTDNSDQGYDSDDSTGTTYGFEGSRLPLRHMPQVFIM